MGDKTGISWTDATWNPIAGCSVISPACTNCYAMAMAARIEAMNAGERQGRGRWREGQLQEVPLTHYAGLTQPSKAGPVWTGKIVQAPDYILAQPLHWKRPRRIFVNSMSDLFHESVPDEWIDRIFAVMAFCAKTKVDGNEVITGYEARHIFQVLTKRSRRMREYMTELKAAADGSKGTGILGHRLNGAARRLSYDLGHPFWPNAPFTIWGWISDGFPGLWLGVSAEDRSRANERISDLLATPAAKRFVSIEPMLGPVDLGKARGLPVYWEGDASDGPLPLTSWGKEIGSMPRRGWVKHSGNMQPWLDWVICGGESGPNARPMHAAWPRALRDQCAAAAVPFFFKQWGEWAPHRPKAGGDLGGDMRRGFVQHVQFDREPDGHFRAGDCYMARVGKRAAGDLLDGVEHKAFPHG